MSNTITINGRTIVTNGKNITISNNNIIIDDEMFNLKDYAGESYNIEVVVDGDCNDIDTNGSVTVHGNCRDIDANGSVVCYGDILGDIDCNGKACLKREAKD